MAVYGAAARVSVHEPDAESSSSASVELSTPFAARERLFPFRRPNR